MCNCNLLPGANHTHAHTAMPNRNQRRLAERSKRKKRREARKLQQAGGVPQRKAAAVSAEATVERAINAVVTDATADDAEEGTPCAFCHDPECDGGEFCPERPHCGSEGCTGNHVELQEYEMAVKLHGIGGSTDATGKLLRTFVALDPDEANRVRSRLEGLQSSGKIVKFWMNPYRTWLSRMVDTWLDSTVPAEIEAARVARETAGAGAGEGKGESAVLAGRVN